MKVHISISLRTCTTLQIDTEDVKYMSKIYVIMLVANSNVSFSDIAEHFQTQSPLLHHSKQYE